MSAREPAAGQAQRRRDQRRPARRGGPVVEERSEAEVRRTRAADRVIQGVQILVLNGVNLDISAP
jgi:hypothetical protein